MNACVSADTNGAAGRALKEDELPERQVQGGKARPVNRASRERGTRLSRWSNSPGRVRGPRRSPGRRQRFSTPIPPVDNRERLPPRSCLWDAFAGVFSCRVATTLPHPVRNKMATRDSRTVMDGLQCGDAASKAVSDSVHSPRHKFQPHVTCVWTDSSGRHFFIFFSNRHVAP